MKVSLVLYGYYNNRADANAGDKGYEYIKTHIYNECVKHQAELDVFIHTWDEQNLNKINHQYNPISYICEKQYDFNTLAIKHGIDETKINEGFNRSGTIYEQCTINASLSFFYSRSTAIQLCIDHANKNGFEYDCVIVCRFDLGQRSGFHRGYNVSNIRFDLTLDMEYIYSAMWVQLNAGYADQWFYSNQKNINELSKMFEASLKDYFHVGSEYMNAIMSNWIDSNSNNQFSNEILLPNNLKTNSYYKYPKWEMINNHILHKWHFIKTGLYSKSKFIC